MYNIRILQTYREEEEMIKICKDFINKLVMIHKFDNIIIRINYEPYICILDENHNAEREPYICVLYIFAHLDINLQFVSY